MREELLRQIANYVKPYRDEGKGIRELSKSSTDGTKAIQNKDSDTKEITASSFLRKININSDSYGKNGKSLVDDIPQNENEEKTKRNGFIMSVMNTTGKDIQEMQKQGLSPENIDPRDFVTVSDKIKVSLAKGGVDVSAMGGLDSETIEKVTGNASVASGIERNLKAADLPVDVDTVKNVKEADFQFKEISNKLGSDDSKDITQDTAKYLIKNTKEPTIDNVYQAIFAGNTADDTSINEAVQNTEVPKELEDSFGKVINEAGIKNDSESQKEAAWLLSEDLPVTPKNLTFLNKLINNPVLDSKAVSDNIIDTISNGKKPQDACVIAGFSMQDKANEAISTIKNAEPEKVQNAKADVNTLNIKALRIISVEIMIESKTGSGTSALNISTTDVSAIGMSAQDLLNNAKNLMTRDSLVTLQKLGINIETEPILNMINEITNMSSGSIADLNNSEQELYNKTISEADEMSDLPASIIGSYKYIGYVSFQKVYEDGQRIKNSLAEKTPNFEKIGQIKAYDKMTDTYNAVGTEVRKDLGDSIKKAFGNVDTILNDMGYDTSDENRRTIRILGYNNLEITDENILSIKASDELVQKTLKELTPKTVLSMIKDGKNPLDMSMEELSTEAENYKDGSDSEDKKSQDMAEFLWKAEKNKDITDTEKKSYIGIYRLIHQVNESDGAVIGQLLHQNTSVTMRNMMTAVRSKKHEGQEVSIDDNFGMTKEVKKSELNITQQIELSFQKSHLKNAEETMTPVKLHAMGGESAYIDMTPEQFDTALQYQYQNGDNKEKQNKIDEENQAWYEYRSNEIKSSVVQEDKIYNILEKMDIPTSPANLAATYNMISNGRKVFDQLAKYHVNADGSVVDVNNPDIKAMTQQLMEKYGEACKTPEEMAEAQEHLADQAENVMKNFAGSENGEYLDLKAIQAMSKELSLYGKMADDEIYHIPVMVADQNGVMTLKIVRGEENRGLVDIFIEGSESAKTRASFKADSEGVTGKIETTDKSYEEYFLNKRSELEERISKESGLTANLEIKENDISDITDLYQRNVDNNGTDTVSTKKLYSVAKAFIDTLSQRN